jgi:hypothetical protein
MPYHAIRLNVTPRSPTARRQKTFSGPRLLTQAIGRALSLTRSTTKTSIVQTSPSIGGYVDIPDANLSIIGLHVSWC